jgi:hypothetical protein
MTPTDATDLPPWTPLNEPGAAFAAGILALSAAIAAALASRIAAPLFGAMLAVGLAGNAGMLAVHGTQTARWGLVRVLGWGLDGLGWIVFAVLLLHTPLAYPDTLRAVATTLIALGGILRLLDRLAQEFAAAPGLPVTMFLGAAAILILWFRGLPPAVTGPLQTIAIAVCLELCAAASAWLEAAWIEHARRGSKLVERAMTRAAVRYTALHQS